MSEYPIGLRGEMVHCLDDSEYAHYCWSKLEQQIKDTSKSEAEKGK